MIRAALEVEKIISHPRLEKFAYNQIYMNKQKADTFGKATSFSSSSCPGLTWVLLPHTPAFSLSLTQALAPLITP